MSIKDDFYEAIAAHDMVKIEDLINDDEIKALLTDAKECDQLLSYACTENTHFDLLPFLLQKIQVENYFAQHTLASACAKGYVDVVDILLKREAAHYYLVVAGFQDAVSLACLNGQKAIVELISSHKIPFKNFDVQARGFDYYKIPDLIIAACLGGFTDIIDRTFRLIRTVETYEDILSEIPANMMQYLLEKTPLKDYNRLISLLCKKDKADSINMLHESEAINMNDIATQQQLLEAIGENGSMRTLNYLIETFASISLTQPIGVFNQSILHLACRWGHVDMVTMLLEKGLNPDITDIHNNTPLLFACAQRNIDVVNVLLAYKCNVNQKDNLNFGCLHYLVLLIEPIKSIAIFDLLVIEGIDYNGSSPFTTIHMAIVSHNVMMVERLINLRVEINCFDDRQYTPLMSAAETGNIDIIKLILQHPDLDYHATNSENETAAMIAAKSPLPEIRDFFNELNETLSSSSSCRFG